MKYRILNQGIGVTETAHPEDINGSLTIEIEGAEGNVIKLIGEDNISYARVENGVATFDRSVLVGRIALSLVRASGTVPLGALICVPIREGIRVYPDVQSVLDRIGKVERDISDLLSMQRDLTAKYDDMIKRIEQLFDGYSF